MILLLLLLAVQASVWASPGTWIRIGDQQAPGAQYGAKAIYCPNRDSMLIFGGYRATPSAGKFLYYSDLWEYRFTSKDWARLDPLFKPSPRIYSTFTALETTNPNECAAIVYGGYAVNDSSVVQLSDTWFLNLTGSNAQWEQLKTSMATPGERFLADAVYRRGTVVLFGGMRITDSGGGLSFNDLWTFTLGQVNENNTRAISTWAEVPLAVSTPGPDTRFQHTMVLNPGMSAENDQLIVFAGRRYDGLRLTRMNSDLLIYTFGTNTWKAATGTVKIERAGHASTFFAGRFVSFGGFTQLQSSSSPPPGYLFNNILVTNLNNVFLQSHPTLDNPICTASDGRSGLWCVATVDQDVDVPSLRSQMATAVRNDIMLVYGGASQSAAFSDLWAMNMTAAVSSLKIADSDTLGATDLASTMYFMIAILSMMVVCFMIFVISLRRQRTSGQMFQTMMINRPRVVGARQSVIEALPLKTYRKKEAEERRMSRRQSRKDSQHSSKSISAGTTPVGEASAISAAVVVAANPAGDGDRIEQDDLHDLCAICLTDYEDGEQLRVLPCEHFFHPPCVDQWLRTHNACPMCKAAVDPDPERSDEAQIGSQVVAGHQSAVNPYFAGEDANREASNATNQPSGEEREGATRDTASSAPRDPTRDATSAARREATSAAAPDDASSNLVVIDLSAEAPRTQDRANSANV